MGDGQGDHIRRNNPNLICGGWDAPTFLPVSQVKGFLARWLSDAMTFYTQLVERIQKAYDFQLSQLVCGNTLFQSKTHRRTVSDGREADHSCLHP